MDDNKLGGFCLSSNDKQLITKQMLCLYIDTILSSYVHALPFLEQHYCCYTT